MKLPQSMPPALVLGINIHGLAVCRALARAGVRVYAIAAEKNASTYTRYADVEVRPEVNTDMLVELLRNYADEKAFREKPVLFPTNDRMVRNIAKAWSELHDRYELSWKACRSQVLSLQRKDNLVHAAASAHIPHPASVIIESNSDIEQVTSKIGYPCIIKPAEPLSRFKVCRLESECDLQNRYQGWVDLLPLVAQEWIEGSDSDLYFYAAFWMDGAEVASFVGRKVHSEPPAMGQGTLIAACHDAVLQETGRRVAASFRICGPVALEFKRTPDGELILIEPNVGRTEYCVDLLIQSGLNLPLLEYETTIGATGRNLPQQMTQRAWYDTDKDPRIYIREVLSHRTLFPHGYPIFPYFGHRDLVPLAISGLSLLRRAVRTLLKKAFRLQKARQDI